MLIPGINLRVGPKFLKTSKIIVKYLITTGTINRGRPREIGLLWLVKGENFLNTCRGWGVK